MSLSIAVHAALLAALFLLWRQTAPDDLSLALRRVNLVLAQPRELDEIEYLESSDLEAMEPAPAEENPTAIPTESPSPPVDLPPIVENRLLPGVEMESMDAEKMTEVPSNANKLPGGELTPEQLKRLEAERAAFEALKPKGPPATISVFDSGKLEGQSFVFVLDRSKSMGSQGLNMLDAAAEQLSQAIGQLEEYHKFQIVAYHHQTVMLSKRTLIPATEANKQAVYEFVTDLAALGGTEHDRALHVALSFEPDVVVLMTDGGLPVLNGGQLQQIHRSAGPDTQIHCVQFGSGPMQDEGNFMQRLALQNNGGYRYIDAMKWDEK